MTAQACRHHPEEAAVGLCIACSAPLCVACITKVDGINHCQSCLLSRAQLPASGAHAAEAPALREPGAQRKASAWLTLALGVLVLGALAWTTLNALLPVEAP